MATFEATEVAIELVRAMRPVVEALELPDPGAHRPRE
jgi:hypothetical protein